MSYDICEKCGKMGLASGQAVVPCSSDREICPRAAPEFFQKFLREMPSREALGAPAQSQQYGLLKLPGGLHLETASLVTVFAEAMAAKLRAAESKYGYGAGWADSKNWSAEECRKALLEHIEKGDPRDVANYCAFMWYHGWSTTPAQEPFRQVDPALPIPMLLFCPKCSAQHVDAPQPEAGWTNPPHKSHLCHTCGTIWRPADVATVGVLDIVTCGEDDNWQRPGWAADQELLRSSGVGPDDVAEGA